MDQSFKVQQNHRLGISNNNTIIILVLKMINDT